LTFQVAVELFRIARIVLLTAILWMARVKGLESRHEIQADPLLRLVWKNNAVPFGLQIKRRDLGRVHGHE
jgi:hypothetical protein